MRVGVLALQGDVAEHLRMLETCGVEAAEVRTPDELRGVEGLVLPGGESTTIWRLLHRYGLAQPLRDLADQDFPLFATCAGTIVAARSVVGDHPPGLGLLDVIVERNAYGRQRESFETEIEVPEVAGDPVKVAFIRAPVIVEVGSAVRVLATNGGRPVVVRQGQILAATCHPEIRGDHRLHRYFVERVIPRPWAFAS
ncbi:MAG: pyridoxal 5'-phosphate synthase glutaminase subunit PdxT [bacterium]|nr:pyridoxal 5'-phosphate synthase glutaminase subunit PdxT [bacterium]